MKSSLPTDPRQRLAVLIKNKRKRDGLGVNEAARACGVYGSTISRIERLELPNLPDGKTLVKLAKWLETPLSQLLGEDRPAKATAKLPEVSPPETLEVQLRADKNLSVEAAEALSKMFKVLYDQAVKGNKE